MADENVVVLDPACGTGAYLVEVLNKISVTLKHKHGEALAGVELKTAAGNRIFGFELIPAPFVVSHLQIGLVMQKWGVPFDTEKKERAGVYLTNALTGWEMDSVPTTESIPFKEFREEKEAASSVKCDRPILVILGNPPYNAFAGVSPEEEGGLVEAYKDKLNTPVEEGGWGITKFNLDDLYIRFFRIAERKIMKSGQGIVSYISNFSYLGDPSYVVMRNKLIDGFDIMWFDCMNGDSRETGKKNPDGQPDPSVFSTEDRKVGIRVGTAVCMMLKKATKTANTIVRYKDYWGVTKREDILESLNIEDFNATYQLVEPEKRNRYSFRPLSIDETYFQWPLLSELCSHYFAGIAEDRGKALISIDREPLEKRMQMYFDENVSWGDLESLETGLTNDVPDFDALKTRDKILELESYQIERIVKFAMRPFDIQWCYYTPIHPLWRRCRPEYWKSFLPSEPCIVTRFNAAKIPEGSPITFARQLCDYHVMSPNATVIPMRVRREAINGQTNQTTLFFDEETHDAIKANLSKRAYKYYSELSLTESGIDSVGSGALWFHVLAIGYSPAYLEENADGIRQNWPRIPLPVKKETLFYSAELGERVAELLDTETGVDGVTQGNIRAEVKNLGVLSRVGGGSLDPNQGHFDLTAGWGHAGRGSACYPGKGKWVIRKATDEKQKTLFGEETLDVYLNDDAYWSNVPKAVWDYYIGGHQILKKWLSYREKKLLGRSLKLEEVRYFQEMVRRLAALVMMHDKLDKNYQAVKSATWDWYGN